MYFLPAQNEAQDCAFPVEANDVVLAMSCCVQPSVFGCSNDMINLAAVLLKQTNLDFPKTVDEARNLFVMIINSF